jgi:hypothetical protein
MDPLSPFTNLIRSLWHSRMQRAGARTGQSEAPTTPPTDAVDATRRAHGELRDRMAQLQQATPEHRCEVFVRTVLLCELGEKVAADPRFSELVTRVVSELRTDPRVATRLDELLLQLPRQGSP